VSAAAAVPSPAMLTWYLACCAHLVHASHVDAVKCVCVRAPVCVCVCVGHNQVVAVPESINVLDGVSDDCRTSDKLVSESLPPARGREGV